MAHAFEPSFSNHNPSVEIPTPPRSGELLARRRACEDCRRLKVQCKYDSLQSAACKRCSKASRPCVITQRRPRAKGNPKVAELERQIQEISASLEAMKAQSSQQDGQPQEVPVSAAFTPESSSSVKYSERAATSGYDEEHTEEPHLQPNPHSIGLENLIETHALPPNHPPLSSRAKPVGQLPLPTYSDVVDQGWITMDTAQKALDHFVINIMPQFSIVVIQAPSDAADMRRNSPVLFLSVLNAASGTLPTITQRKINRELQRVLADRVLVVGEKSLELIQALQIAMFWYYPPERYEELKYYQLIHITCVMAIEIGLNRRGKAIKVSGLIEARRGPSLQRKQHPDSSLIECRRAWLGCYFLAALTAQNTRRTNLIRWSPYLEECLQLLETSTEAMASDITLCHWIRLQRIADEIGQQFNVEDPTVLDGLNDMQMKHMVQGFEAQWRECILRTLNVPKSPSIIFGETQIRLYLHEVALNTGKNNDDLQPPFTPEIFKSMRPLEKVEISAGHIDSLSTSLTSIHTLYQAFLSIPPATIRCLPTFHFVRLIYLSVVFIKLTADGDDFNVEQYLDDVLGLLSLAAQDNQSASARQFSMVITVLKTLIVKRKPTPVGVRKTTSRKRVLEPYQTGPIPQQGTAMVQPIVDHQNVGPMQETGMFGASLIGPDPAHFGLKTAPTGFDKANGVNSNTFGLPYEASMNSDGVSEPLDLDMIDGDNFPAFFMDDDLIHSILASAPPDFFMQFDMDYTS